MLPPHARVNKEKLFDLAQKCLLLSARARDASRSNGCLVDNPSSDPHNRRRQGWYLEQEAILKHWSWSRFTRCLGSRITTLE